MAEFLPVVLLGLIFLAGLILIPFGLPGIWLMVAALIGFAAFDGFERVGIWVLSLVVVLAIVGEALDVVIGFGFAAKYGGSRRAGWGAIAGGLVGAVLGTPVPVVGNLVGAFVGAFVGAVILESTQHGELGRSLSAGWGAVVGKAVASSIKIALGLAIAVLGIFAALN